MPDDLKLSTVCPKCGITIRYPAKFAGKDAHCKSCGASLVLPEDPFIADIVGDLPPVTSGRIPIPAPEEPINWGPAAARPKQVKSRIGSALLAFFLGPLGFHRFYLNQTGTGLVILLLTFSGCGLLISVPLSLIDCLGFLLMSDEDFAERY